MLIQNANFLKNEYRAALLPCMLSILSGCLNILADGVLVGQRIGIDGLAALSLCVPIYLILCVIGSFFVSGTAIPASDAIGKGEMELAQKYYGTCLVCCVVASGIVTVIGLSMLPAIAQAMTPEEHIRVMVQAYAGVTIVGSLPKVLIYIPYWYLRLEGKNRAVTAMTAIMGVGNVFLDIVFMYWMGLGVYGAALASVIATTVACLYGFIVLHTGHTNFLLRPALLRTSNEWKRIPLSGSPAALNNLFQTIRILAINAILYELGQNTMVATFTAINGIAAFAEAVTVGVPSAGTAMLGVYHGERDNGSCRILLKREWQDGVVLTAIFGLAIVFLTNVIRAIYSLEETSLFVPILCLAASLFPGLWNSMMISFYSVSSHEVLSDLIIACRVFIFTILSLLVCKALSISVWLFLPLSECLTIIFWLVATKILSMRQENCTRFLLMDTTLEKSGQVINFSVPGTLEEICSACSKISDFCSKNGMSSKEYIKISLSMEEMMTLIIQVNEGTNVTFDLRIFSIKDALGIRIRYDGIAFDPTHIKECEDNAFMGIRMLDGLVNEIIYRKVFGVNTLLISL